MAAITVTPTSGRAKMSVLRIDVTGLDDTDFNTYDAAHVPAEHEIRYYIEATLDGTRYLKSHEFTPSQAGKHTWNSIVVPATGTWTFGICDVADDSTKATTEFVAS